MTWQESVAQRIARFAGDDARVAELRSHLEQVEAHGDRVGLADVGSIVLLAGRRAAKKVVSDLPWMGVSVLVTLPFLLLLAHSYETHFFAWDMANDQAPVSASARSWSRTIDLLTILGLLAALVACRRAIEHLRQGRIMGPSLLAVAALIAFSQSDLFIERTPWFRDGRLRAEHIEEVPFYSVGLYATFVAIPVCFLIWDLLSRKRHPRRRDERSTEPTPIDVRAIAAAGSIFLVVFQPLIAPLAMLGFLWAAEPFTKTLKIVGTIAVLAPINTLIGFAVVSDVDDPPVVFLALLIGTAVVWLRVAFVALRPFAGTHAE